MKQVKELLELIRGMKMNRVVVAMNFIMHRIQPCKERSHTGFDFKGDTDGNRERSEALSKDEVVEQAIELFAPLATF